MTTVSPKCPGSGSSDQPDLASPGAPESAVLEPPGADRTTRPPENLEAELCALVVSLAPRLFAVVQERGLEAGEADVWVAAWGVAYHDGHADVISVDGRRQFSLDSSERAAEWFERGAGITSHLVWLVRPTAAAFDRADAA
ncbi:hypothetical protein [Streptomyces sp. 7N604]|uniref:hypothetical protein n=1 Tax=Streptomyces sp. 7N604 TaxID=3457415 RepID=UPI003FD27D1C